MANKHLQFNWTREAALIVVGIVVVCCLSAVLGLLVGVILRNQVLALGVVTLWTLAIDSAVLQLAPDAWRWGPGGAQAAVYRDVVGDTLPMLAGVALLLGWIAVFAAAAAAALRRRDLA